MGGAWEVGSHDTLILGGHLRGRGCVGGQVEAGATSVEHIPLELLKDT